MKRLYLIVFFLLIFIAQAFASSLESYPLQIKGSQTITFRSRTLEGSKEGSSTGSLQSREETLRLNVVGKSGDVDIEANLYRTTGLGTSQLTEREEELSIRLRRGSLEAYLGDFNADLKETEFTYLDRMLSGGKIKGDFDSYGFVALYSSPKGEAKFTKMYGDDSQGPYSLDFSPVVINSERIYVDGILQIRGEDYNIDYQAGTVTFIKRIIDDKSIVEAYYDYRQTVYQHSTYGLRGYLKPNQDLRVGVTYLNDSDGLENATSIRNSITGEAINPQSHYVIGLDSDYSSEYLSADGELAYSYKDLNILSGGVTTESGRAGKINVSSDFGPFNLDLGAKKVGNFTAIADPDPKQSLWVYNGALTFRPGSIFGASLSQDYEKYDQSSVTYENLYKNVKAQVVPDNWPSFEYIYRESDESNDPVTGSLIRRIITRDSLETLKQASFWSMSIKGTKEKWLTRSPSEETTEYQKVNVGLATMGLSNLSFSSNIELEKRKEPTGLEPDKRTYNLNLSVTPSKKFYVTSAFQIIQDSALGNTSVVDLAYSLKPSKFIKTEGKYSINALDESFPTTKEAVTRQTGSLSLDLRPFDYLRLRYLYKPNFTQIVRTSSRSYNNEQQQAEINLLPTKYVLIGLIRKLGNTFNVYNNDYPNYTVKNNNRDTNSTLYTLKMAPFRVLSTEFNLLEEGSIYQTLATTQEPHTYDKTNTAGRKFDAIVKTSLSEKFSIDSRYTYQKTDQGSAEAISDVVDTVSHTGSIKGLWNLSSIWSFSLSGAFTQSYDQLLSNTTYTLAPGFGFIYRYASELRIDFDYVYSKSYQGASTQKHTLALRTKYALSEFVNLILRADQEHSFSPDYRLTDITANVEISF